MEPKRRTMDISCNSATVHHVSKNSQILKYYAPPLKLWRTSFNILASQCIRCDYSVTRKEGQEVVGEVCAHYKMLIAPPDPTKIDPNRCHNTWDLTHSYLTCFLPWILHALERVKTQEQTCTKNPTRQQIHRMWHCNWILTIGVSCAPKIWNLMFLYISKDVDKSLCCCDWFVYVKNYNLCIKP
jgi:hypothetical protein